MCERRRKKDGGKERGKGERGRERKRGIRGVCVCVCVYVCTCVEGGRKGEGRREREV